MSMANALQDFLAAAQILIIRGDAPEVDQWSAAIGAWYAPGRMIFGIPRDAADLPAVLAAKSAMDATVAYVCNGMTCSAPLTDLDAVLRTLTLRIA